MSERSLEQTRRFNRYLAVWNLLPDQMRTIGNAEHGEICIVLDPEEMAEIEETWQKEFLLAGLNPDDARIGLIYEDRVKWHLNDAVRITAPDGSVVRRGWDRIIWKNGIVGKSAVVVPITPDGRVVMVPAYRHPVGRWELELPGGGSTKAATHVEAVKFELLEEAGYTAGKIMPMEAEGPNGEALGFFHTDPSTSVTPQRVYAVMVDKKTETAPELGEVFGRAMLFSRSDLEALFHRGYVNHPTLPGVRCYPQDGRNGYGLLMAILKGLIK